MIVEHHNIYYRRSQVIKGYKIYVLNIYRVITKLKLKKINLLISHKNRLKFEIF
jgi:hypothetical protein